MLLYLSGLILKIPVFDQVNDEEELFEDLMFWNVPEEEGEKSEVELAARKYVEDRK